MQKARYAVDAAKSRGRIHEESRTTFRSPFQRDRDRVIHATAFRRLKDKTQVFLAQEGDLFRTRLTHSIEVAQVARTLARALRVDEDLAETIALAHDLGHPPFGHTGEDMLQKLMKPYGGFDHNAQAIRIVAALEAQYACFDGLNLTWETLEGMAKHNGPVAAPYPWALVDYEAHEGLELNQFASLEAQIAAIADDIAYNHHDILDGLRAGLFDDEEIAEVSLIGRAYADVDKQYPKLDPKRRRFEAMSRVFSYLVEDVLQETGARLASLAPQTASDIRNADRQMVQFSKEMRRHIQSIRSFLFAHMYRHEQVVEMRAIADMMVERSFNALFETPSLLPEDWRARMKEGDETSRARTISDYISGMTDRYIATRWFSLHELNWPDFARI